MIRSTPEFDQRVADWLEADPSAAPADVLSTVVAALPSIPQARRGLLAPRRFTQMTNVMRAAAAVAIVGIVGVGVLGLIVRAPSPGGSGSPAPTPTAGPTATVTPTATVAPTSTVAPSPSLSMGPIYRSNVYGFSIGYPQGWKFEAAAQRRWDPAVDAPLDFSSQAIDTFTNPAGTVAFSAWLVPHEADINLDSRQDLMEFAQTFCIASDNAPCTRIPERAVQMCREQADCHPAIIVPFNQAVMAFFGATEDGHVNVVAVWQGDTAPEVAEYGGSIELLKTILSSMNVWTPQPGQAFVE